MNTKRNPARQQTQQQVEDSMIFERIIELDTAIHRLQVQIRGRDLSSYKTELGKLAAKTQQLQEVIAAGLAIEEA